MFKVCLNCERYPRLIIICQNQFELASGTKLAQAAVIAGEKFIRNAGHGLQKKPFVQVRQETSVSCQRHSLSSSIPCSNSFTGKRSKSTVPCCPTHNPSLHPNLLLTADLERPWGHPSSSGLQFALVAQKKKLDHPRWISETISMPHCLNRHKKKLKKRLIGIKWMASH